MLTVQSQVLDSISPNKIAIKHLYCLLKYGISCRTYRWRLCYGGRYVSHFLTVEEVVLPVAQSPLLDLPSRCLPGHRSHTREVCTEDTRPAPGPLIKLLGGTTLLFSAMATSAKRKQEETHLKMLREMTSLPANRKCFDCDQRGPTYVNMTVGSFVCTTCSGILWVSF